VRPYPEELVRIIQSGVMAHLAPEVQSTYGKAQLTFMMLLFGLAQRGGDTAVPDLLETNAALRQMLADIDGALAQVDRDDARSARGDLAALPAPETALTLSALRREHDVLRAALVALSPLLEPAADEPALAPLREVRSRLYAWLAADARKRSVPILGG
jgi:hypothetical protein